MQVPGVLALTLACIIHSGGSFHIGGQRPLHRSRIRVRKSVVTLNSAPECGSPQGKRLRQVWEEQDDDAFMVEVATELIKLRGDSLPEKSQVVEDIMSLLVENEYKVQDLPLSSSTEDPCLELADALGILPLEPAQAVGHYVRTTIPQVAGNSTIRVDRLQGARLYMGSVQFGYMVGAVAGDLQSSVSDAVNGMSDQELGNLARSMRTEAAWVVSSDHAGTLFALPRAPDGKGFPQLRKFSKGIQVAASQQATEFFASDEEDTTPPETPAAAAREASGLPPMDLVPLTVAKLQDLLAEACLFGWFLSEKEAQLEQVVGEI